MMMHQHNKSGYKKVKLFRISCQDKHLMQFWTSAVNMTLKAAKQSFHKKLQFMMMYHETKFGCKRIGSSQAIIKRHIPKLWCELDTENSNTIYCYCSLGVFVCVWFWGCFWFLHLTFQLMIMHHYIKFGYKKFSISKAIILMNINGNFEPLL